MADLPTSYTSTPASNTPMTKNSNILFFHSSVCPNGRIYAPLRSSILLFLLLIEIFPLTSHGSYNFNPSPRYGHFKLVRSRTVFIAFTYERLALQLSSNTSFNLQISSFILQTPRNHKHLQVTTPHTEISLLDQIP